MSKLVWDFIPGKSVGPFEFGKTLQEHEALFREGTPGRFNLSGFHRSVFCPDLIASPRSVSVGLLDPTNYCDHWLDFDETTGCLWGVRLVQRNDSVTMDNLRREVAVMYKGVDLAALGQGQILAMFYNEGAKIHDLASGYPEIEGPNITMEVNTDPQLNCGIVEFGLGQYARRWIDKTAYNYGIPIRLSFLDKIR